MVSQEADFFFKQNFQVIFVKGLKKRLQIQLVMIYALYLFKSSAIPLLPGVITHTASDMASRWVITKLRTCVFSTC